MIITADKNIPDIETRCAGLGDVRLFDSRDLPGLKELLRNADVLLCRSTIRVDAALLEGTRVRFVATATAGTDHVDTAWLESQDITFASAAGSNARSVAEWWGAAMLELQARGRLSIPGVTVGVIGVGHVGTEVADVARALGMSCHYNDPPRALRGEQPVPWSAGEFSEMEEILRCDVVSLHVPLAREGQFPTAGFFAEGEFARMRPGAAFVNAARGGVMNAAAVRSWSAAGNPVVLDVFPDEPRIDPALVRAADIATPHIAGHAWDGKLRGTAMVVHALRHWIAVGPHRDAALRGPARPPVRRSEPKADEDGSARSGKGEHSVRANSREEIHSEVLEVVRGIYDIRIDDAALRHAAESGGEASAAEFARLRAEYRVRREFASCEIDGAGLSADAAAMLQALGFTLR